MTSQNLAKRDSRNPPKDGLCFPALQSLCQQTALENILEGLVVARKIPKEEAIQRAESALEKLVSSLTRITILLNCQVVSSNGSESRVPSQ